jgi:hypothetical protein
VTDGSACIPELAGISTYTNAARIGFSVDENVRRLLRLHWAERQIMRTLVAHVTSTPEWEVKCAMCLHQWYCAEHAEMLRRRIVEMRHPAPVLDAPPDAPLDAFLEELLRSANTLELLVGVRCRLARLRDAYRAHIAQTNQLVDHPTRRLMRLILVDVDEAIDWGQLALAAIADGGGTAEAGANGTKWRSHLQAYLRAAGGIAGGDDPVSRDPYSLPAPRASDHSRRTSNRRATRGSRDSTISTSRRTSFTMPPEFRRTNGISRCFASELSKWTCLR